MENRVDVGLLWGRAAIVGLLASGLGILGHVSADGLLPGPTWLIAIAAASVLFSVPMLARPASALRVVALVVGGQTFTHLSLSVTAGHAGDVRGSRAAPSYPDAYAPALPVVDGRRVGSLLDAYRGAVEPSGPVAPALPAHLVADVSANAPMMVAHLVAAVLVGLWLAHGERCLWTIVALTGRRLLGVAAIPSVVVVLPRRPTTVLDRVPSRPRSLSLVRPLTRRGPPLLLAT